MLANDLLTSLYLIMVKNTGTNGLRCGCGAGCGCGEGQARVRLAAAQRVWCCTRRQLPLPAACCLCSHPSPCCPIPPLP